MYTVLGGSSLWPTMAVSIYFYRFKFRATNIKGQYTDSDYSDPIKTLGKENVTTTLVALCTLWPFC